MGPAHTKREKDTWKNMKMLEISRGQFDWRYPGETYMGETEQAGTGRMQTRELKESLWI